MKTYLYALLLTGICVKASAQSDVATAKWMPQPASIDGKLTEWKQPLSFYDDNTKLLFDIANDSSNIYLCFKSEDEMNQTKLMRAGMKITLSTKSKPKHEATITYPMPQSSASKKQANNNTAEENESAPDEQTVHDLASFRSNFLQHHTTMNVEGFASANGEIPVTNSYGIIAAINWDSTSNLIYEIAIPKKEFFGASFSAKDASADINLSVEINKMQQHYSASKNDDAGSRNNQGAPGAGMHGRGMRNGMGSGFGGGRQLSDADRSTLNQKTSFKQKFVLSTPNS